MPALSYPRYSSRRRPSSTTVRAFWGPTYPTIPHMATSLTSGRPALRRKDHLWRLAPGDNAAGAAPVTCWAGAAPLVLLLDLDGGRADLGAAQHVVAAEHVGGHHRVALGERRSGRRGHPDHDVLVPAGAADLRGAVADRDLLAHLLGHV